MEHSGLVLIRIVGIWVDVAFRHPVEERHRNFGEVRLLDAVDPDVGVHVNPERQAGTRARVALGVNRVERQPRHAVRRIDVQVVVEGLARRILPFAALLLERQPVLDRELLVRAASWHRGDEVPLDRAVSRSFVHVEPDALRRLAHEKVAQRIAGASLAGGEHDLRNRRPVHVAALDRRAYAVEVRLCREEYVRLHLLGMAGSFADCAVEVAELRPPHFELPDVHGEDRRIKLVRRRPFRGILVEACVVGVLHGIFAGVVRLELPVYPAGIEEPVVLGASFLDSFRDIAQPIRCRRLQLLRKRRSAARRIWGRRLVRDGLYCLEPYGVAARVFQERVRSPVRVVGVERARFDVYVLLYLLGGLFILAVVHHLVVHRLHRKRTGHVHLGMYLRLAARVAVAQVLLGVLVLPRGGIYVNLEWPDDVKSLLRSPEHLDLPRVLARVANRPEVVLLVARAVLIDVYLAVVGFVRHAARDHREQLFRAERPGQRPQLVAYAYVDLRLRGLQDFHKLVCEHHALVQLLVKTGIDYQERSAGALDGLQLRHVEVHVAVAVVRTVRQAVPFGVHIIPVIAKNLDGRRRIEVYLVVAAELHRRTRVLERLEHKGCRVGGAWRLGPCMGPVETHGPLLGRSRYQGDFGARRAVRKSPLDLEGTLLRRKHRLREIDPYRHASSILRNLGLLAVPVLGRRKRLAKELVRGDRRYRRADHRPEVRHLLGAVCRPLHSGAGSELDGVVRGVNEICVRRVSIDGPQIVRRPGGHRAIRQQHGHRAQSGFTHEPLLSPYIAIYVILPCPTCYSTRGSSTNSFKTPKSVRWISMSEEVVSAN